MEDVLIIGAGIFGLTLARKMGRAGRRVLVAEAGEVGAGASATPLGVLAPHAPDNWNDKKEAQFRALISLPSYVAALEDETGMAVGYRRCGRMMPLTTANQRAIWQRRIEDARVNWRGEAALSVTDDPDPDWLAPDIASHGALLCGLSATIDARAYLAALAASVGDAIRTGLSLDRIEEGVAVFANGERIAARHVVLATGANAFRHWPSTEKGDPAGRGEKGQAALMRTSAPLDGRPILYHDGTYIVPRDEHIAAVGATSERYFDDAEATDALLDEKMAMAVAMCPALADARVVERWASVRPRAADRGLLVGPHPQIPGISVATGGFKTGLAMAHMLDPEALDPKTVI